MTSTEPYQLYFRHRHDGAVVYRVEKSGRQRRVELNQIAAIAKTGEVVPAKRHPPSEFEISEIAEWWEDWKAREARNELSQSELFLAELNQFTDWMQRRAENDVVEQMSEKILLALLDLRRVTVRRLADLRTDSGQDDASAETANDPTTQQTADD